MKINVIEKNDVKIAEIISHEIILRNVQDALDLMADADYQGARCIVVYEKNIDPSFFELKSGLAGDILQKYVNYRIKLAVVGSFEKYGSKSLSAFISTG